MVELIILGFLFIFIGLNLYFYSKYKLSKLEERQKDKTQNAKNLIDRILRTRIEEEKKSIKRVDAQVRRYL